MIDAPIQGAVLITGVGKRVGLRLAEIFLDRGQRVIGTFRTDRPALQRLRERGADLVAADFYESEDVDALLEHVREKYASLRAIIHNASDWMPENGSASHDETMRRMMDVHVSVPYRINLALEDLLESDGEDLADIIHIGDYVSARGSKKHIAYAASKAAQDNLTLSFAQRLAPRVKVNSIAPALILFNEADDDAYKEKALNKSLMRREGGLDELVHNVDYLLDSRYVTGRVLHMDGGRHLV